MDGQRLGAWLDAIQTIIACDDTFTDNDGAAIAWPSISIETRRARGGIRVDAWTQRGIAKARPFCKPI